MATQRIEKLTPAQVERLTDYREEWIAVGLSTSPADRLAAEKAADAAYAAAGLEKPTLKIWLQSPMAGAIGSAILTQVGNQVRTQVRNQVWAQVGAQVGD